MMIKAVFFDVDGTLISHKNNVVPESTRIALNLLEKRGIKRIISTGRHMIELEELPVNNIEFDAYITLNGQLCLDSQRNIILNCLRKKQYLLCWLKKIVCISII